MKKHLYKQEIINICYKKHLTVDEIFDQISQVYPKIWKSTIYRNVEELVQTWDLKKLEWASTKTIYEANIWTHAHVVCTQTWKILDISIEDLNIQNLPIDFEVKNIDIKIYWILKKSLDSKSHS